MIIYHQNQVLHQFQRWVKAVNQTMVNNKNTIDIIVTF